MSPDQKRYAISFTPAPGDALAIVGANWIGRNAFSGASIDPPMIGGLYLAEIAYHTAVPRRYGFQAPLKGPFHLADGMSEAMLLNEMMRFATLVHPFTLPRMKVVRRREALAFAPVLPVPAMDALAAAVVDEFDHFRARLGEDELERRDSGDLTPIQFANLHRWGEPDVMAAFSFHMPLSGPLSSSDTERFERALDEFFGPILAEPVEVDNIALFIEEEPGAPFLVHSLHPMGALPARRSA
ncbi:DUF1045 domain-containing protein [Martelella endophytica]|uniref:DUF1045 domain-containing protein n=1 Tax=Martelella endophytica TaxID=1486262 RepID=A0A0D5LKR3_MAREN|nr:DUF1045 domain-containing protein [Martelella endophytica]AJY44756.1 hypothetical protein TM49_02165 [Martelella endophytica]